MPVSIHFDPHPRLWARAFVSTFPAPLGQLSTPAQVTGLLSLDVPTPLAPPDDTVRAAVRDLLRHGGYKPTGRGKPASEYLVRAVGERALGAINVAVDVCNAVSLHSGVPISVVDLERALPPFRIRLGQPGEQYVFNASGQTLDLEGLLCLCDAQGPCANAVKDAQRTKTHLDTRSTLCVLWGPRELAERVERALAWYRLLLETSGVSTQPVELTEQTSPRA